jgi:hypothetical protein
LRASGVHGKGLFARKAFQKGDVMMAVPLETCLVIKVSNSENENDTK